MFLSFFFFFFQAEDGIRDTSVTGVQTCALPISVFQNAARRRRVCGFHHGDSNHSQEGQHFDCPRTSFLAASRRLLLSPELRLNHTAPLQLQHSACTPPRINYSSEVRLKVDFDVTLTEAATGLYRMLGRLLPGYEAAKSRQLFRHFLNAPAEVEIESGRVQVTLPKRAHNPLLINAGLGEKATPMPWWDNRPLQICFR